MLESNIVNKIIKELNSHDGCLVIKKHNNQYGRKGEPDILGSIHGRFVAIEVKQPGKRPTKIQEARLRQWRDAGGVALWATSVDEVKEALKKQEVKL
jgi:Holliday junction resolvase